MIHKEQVDKLPHAIGLYFFKNKNSYLYIGKSIDIHNRVLQHIERSTFDEKEKAICEQSETLEFLVCNSEFNALITESKLIQKYNPKFNVIWRDDKSYLYIKITQTDHFPQISVVRKENDGKSLYFGPFSSTRSVRFLLKHIRVVFPFCMAKQQLKKPCFYSHIGLCSPCPGSVTPETKDSIQKTYKENIRNIVRILKGNWEPIKKKFDQKLILYKNSQQFEKAIPVRNKVINLENLIHLRSFRSFDSMSSYNHEDALEQLCILLGMNASSLGRIECFDISNLMQQQATASMVVATYGIIDKSQYRRFKVKTEGVSDMRMIAEVIRRRFSHNWKKPDLVIIDGGTPQVVTVERELCKIDVTVRVIGIAKRPDRIVYLTPQGAKTLRPRNDNMGFMLIQQLRDEAHRFAKKYHIHLRSKTYFEA